MIWNTKIDGPKTSKEDIFYYVYGLLHSPDYRRTFAADLKKMLPRMPLLEKPADFWAFSQAGRALADLHLDYEKVPPPSVVKVIGADSGKFQVDKMRFPDKADKSIIEFNPWIKITNIPLEAYDYVVNGRPAIEWVMERCQVKTDKDSGIKNDPNDWAEEHEKPRYILDLLLSVIRVSLETMKIVQALPKLEFEDTARASSRDSSIDPVWWDIYKQQPLKLYHPALADWDGDVMVAGVTKTKKGVVWWSAGCIIGEAMSGQPGSGFVKNPILGKPKYVEDGNYWIIDEKKDWVYKFCLPDEEMLAEYEEFKQYIPTIEELQKLTKEGDVF